jgi:hypothetical protein
VPNQDFVLIIALLRNWFQEALDGTLRYIKCSSKVSDSASAFQRYCLDSVGKLLAIILVLALLPAAVAGLKQNVSIGIDDF